MRWQVIFVIALALIAIGLEQRPVVGQLFGRGIARACGGCGICNDCGPVRMPRRMCRGRCRGPICQCLPMAPVPCAPAPIMCPTYETRMHPRRVVGCEMVPTTVCRREAYCETVPVTTYRQVVVTVPQTEYRNVVRHQMVAQQVMVPRRTVSTVWEPRLHRTFRPVCPPPMITPPMPVCTDGCTDFGGGFSPMGMEPEITPFPHAYPQQPMLSVPGAPNMGHPSDHQRVPAPMGEPTFTPTPKDDSHTYYSPWQSVPSRHAYGHSHPHHHYSMADNYSYRTLPGAPLPGAPLPGAPRPETGPRFSPAPSPSASTVWYHQR